MRELENLAALMELADGTTAQAFACELGPDVSAARQSCTARLRGEARPDEGLGREADEKWGPTPRGLRPQAGIRTRLDTQPLHAAV